LSWNLEGTRLLTGGEILQLWHQHVALMEDDSETGSPFMCMTILIQNLILALCILLHILAALFLGKETPVRIEWEAGWAPELVRVF